VRGKIQEIPQSVSGQISRINYIDAQIAKATLQAGEMSDGIIEIAGMRIKSAERIGMRVLIADDHAAVRRSLAQALQDESEIEVIGEASNGAEAIRLTRQHDPDVVLMDVVMPQVDGIEATRQIMRDRPQTRVIGLSVHDSMVYAARMLDAGACAYLLKDCDMEDLLREIRFGDRPLRQSGGPKKSRERLAVATL
jgi:CheY-like chemotaxis protein